MQSKQKKFIYFALKYFNDIKNIIKNPRKTIKGKENKKIKTKCFNNVP